MEGNTQSPGGRVAVELQRRLRIGALDRLLINAVVDTRSRVEGALSEKDLDAAVKEFVRLNGRRHQSYFHAGFRDAIFNRPPASLPADNDVRRRWYWTGMILGWARTESWRRIERAYDERQTVRALGDGADRPSRRAGIQIVTALKSRGREAELPRFVSEKLARRPRVHQLLLEAGTKVYDAEPELARRIFALLIACTDKRKVRAKVAAQAPTVQRRMAHCLRLLGEHREAEELLRGILDGQSADNKAMVHADLGLLQGHFLLLDDVQIPSDAKARQDIVDRLRMGKGEFQAAIAVENAAYAAHGHYCLGVLALASANGADDPQFETAHGHLERARGHFNSARSEYPPSLVARTELYVGVAKAQRHTAQDVQHAAHLLQSALRASAEMPTHFIRDTLEALALSDVAIADVARAMLAAGGDEALDVLAGMGIDAPSVEHLVATKLYERAHRQSRSRVSRAADLRLALARFLHANDVDESQRVLDELEALAIDGIGVDGFLEVIDVRERYDPAWDADDAAMAKHRLLDAKGDYVGALAALRDSFFRNIQDDLVSAAAILDWATSRDLVEGDYEDMHRAYIAAKPKTDDTRPHYARREVAVLVVGGDESHAKANDRVASGIAQQDAGVSVGFVTIDWTANWKPRLDEVARRLPDFDAVVLLRFMRTTFGQHVRRLCSQHGVQWRFCYSGGDKARVRAVLEVAAAARGVAMT